MQNSRDFREYNDFVQNTRNYLKNLSRFKATADNKRERVEMWKAELAAINAPIARYSAMPGGGAAELNSVESLVARREKIQQCIYIVTEEANRLEHIINMVERSVSLLPADDRKILEMRFKENKSWLMIADELHFSEKWVSKKGSKAIKAVAKMLFGDAAIPSQQELFVFAI